MIEDYLDEAMAFADMQMLIEQGEINVDGREFNLRVENFICEACDIPELDPSPGYQNFIGALKSRKNIREQDSKIHAINLFYFENQQNINKTLVKLINNLGMYAETHEDHITLGNQRHVQTIGLQTCYFSGDYKIDTETQKELKQEEAKIIQTVYTAAYALLNYIIDKLPDPKQIENIVKQSEKVELVESRLVKENIIYEETINSYSMGIREKELRLKEEIEARQKYLNSLEKQKAKQKNIH